MKLVKVVINHQIRSLDGEYRLPSGAVVYTAKNGSKVWILNDWFDIDDEYWTIIDNGGGE